MYSTPELRRRIFQLCTKRSLAKILRTEKAVSAPVAEILYETVDLGRLKMMSRVNVSSWSRLSGLAIGTGLTRWERRAAYCDAVRTLDLSPRAPMDVFAQKLKHKSNTVTPQAPQRRALQPEKLLERIDNALKKCPNLTTLMYERPTNPLEDSYIAHLNGSHVTIDIETPFQLSMNYPPPTSPVGKGVLPNAPTFPGMTVRKHTIAIHAHGCPVGEEAKEVWRSWLFDNPELDKRVTSIITPEDGWLAAPLDTLIRFLNMRKDGGCEPMVALALRERTHSGGLTLDQIREVVTALGPGARRLEIADRLLEGLGDFAGVVSILDETTPRLQSLKITYDPFMYSKGPHLSFDRTSTPLPSALKKLRFFSFMPIGGESGDNDSDAYHHAEVALSVYRLGCRECVFQNGNFKLKYQQPEFNKVIRELKS